MRMTTAGWLASSPRSAAGMATVMPSAVAVALSSCLTAGIEAVSFPLTLREKIALLADNGTPEKWLRELSRTWMEADPQEAGYLYADGHVRVYHGSGTLNTILQILSVNAFEKEPLRQLLTAIPSQLSEDNICNQLTFNY